MDLFNKLQNNIKKLILYIGQKFMRGGRKINAINRFHKNTGKFANQENQWYLREQ